MASSTLDHSRVHVVQMARHEERRAMGAFWQGYWNVTTYMGGAVLRGTIAMVVSEHSQHCQDSFLGIHKILGVWQLWWWWLGVYPTAVIVIKKSMGQINFGRPTAICPKNNGNNVFCLNIPKCLPEFGGVTALLPHTPMVVMVNRGPPEPQLVGRKMVHPTSRVRGGGGWEGVHTMWWCSWWRCYINMYDDGNHDMTEKYTL